MSRRTALVPLIPLVVSMTSLCVGTSYAKILFPVAGAAGMTALRIGLSAAMMAAVMRPWRWRPTAAQAGAAARYGVVLACMNLSFYQALRTLPLGIAITIEFLGPLAVATWHSRSAADLAWIGLAAAGIALLVLPGAHGGVDAVGIGFALLAAFFWALYIVTGKRASELVPERWIVCLGLCVASLVAVPVGIAAAGASLLVPHVLATGALVAVLCSALPYSLEIFALKRLPAGVFGTVLSLEPAVGAAAAFAILGERLAYGRWAGMAAVIAASIGSTLGGAGRPPAPGLPPP